jgi:hypothetical protein
MLAFVCVAAKPKPSGIMYVVRHADTSNHSSTCGINSKGVRRANYMKGIFNGSKFEAPKTIIAFQVRGKLQRMEDTVTPLAKSLGLNVTEGPTLEADDDDGEEVPTYEGAKQAIAALEKGVVLVADWSYIVVFCKALGHKCKNFVGNDQVLVVTLKDGVATNMKLETMGFKYSDEISIKHPSPGC